jgi:DNA-binding XRE family transcriptional regulator
MTPKQIPQLTEKQIKTLFSQIIKTDDGSCWTWTGFAHKEYGIINLNNINYYVTRVIYELMHGESVLGFDVCHHCDNPRCVNPDHLFLGTAKDNVDDCHNKKRHAFGSRHGNSKLTEDKIKEIRFRSLFQTQTDLARDFKIHRKTIGKILSGRSWKPC